VLLWLLLEVVELPVLFGRVDRPVHFASHPKGVTKTVWQSVFGGDSCHTRRKAAPDTITLLTAHHEAGVGVFAVQHAEERATEEGASAAISPHLDEETRTCIENIIRWSIRSCGAHAIPVTAEPVAVPLRKMYPMKAEEEVDRQGRDLRDVGALRKRRGSGQLPGRANSQAGRACRLCVDYRGVNTITTRGGYPLPRIDRPVLCRKGPFRRLTSKPETAQFR